MKRYRKASKPSRPGASVKDLKVVCGECSAPMALKPSRYGLFWACTRYPECDGKHGAHPDGRPLGIPANKATKAARIRAHDAFDAYWRSQGWERSAAYRWLREQMGLSKAECHIGRFDIEQCDLVIRVVERATTSAVEH